MDALDVRILRAMGVLPYGRQPQGPDAFKATHLARRVGVTAETVRDRVARLEAVGVIAGYDLLPNLGHLGLDATAYLFRVDDADARSRLAAASGEVGGVVGWTFFLGPAACADLTFCDSNDLATKMEALAKLTGDPAPVPFFGWSMPEVKRELSPLDWRILRALRRKPRASIPELSEDVGVAYRTVKRRYDRMAAEGSFFILPHLDLSRDPGLVPFTLLFYFGPDATEETPRAILRAFDDSLVFAQAPASPSLGNYDLLVFAESVAALDAMRRKGAAIRGVAKVDALVYAGGAGDLSWVDEVLAKRAP